MSTSAGSMPWVWVGAAGAAVGFAYTLSPLTVLFAAALVPLWRWASDGLSPRERRWMIALFCLAVAMRVIAIGGLFLTADPSIPYGNFFGDEEFFKRKTTWLRNVAMGIPISTADFIYAFDQTGDNSYVRVLTYVQALFGLAPYGVHMLNAGLYLAASLVLYRIVRPALGGVAAFSGIALLLFLPSLFIWSVSALKEPLYAFVAALNLSAAVHVVRARRWWARVGAIGAVIVGALVLQGLREGGLALATAGVAGGLILAFLVKRPRLLMAGVVVVPLVCALALSRPAVRERGWAAVQQAALKHWGHINTPGQTYKLLAPRFYTDRTAVATMTSSDAGQFVVRAIWSYATVPLPWRLESRYELAFLPEQIVWYCLLILTPIGVIAGFRRDTLVTSLLLAHGCAAALLVALSGGNVGTLIRHRGLTIPYFAWLAGLGLVVIGHWLLAVRAAAVDSTQRHPQSESKAGPAWL